jgi:hypothetical protein
LIHAEGGLGDVIQFARFVPKVKARGGVPTLLVQPELVRLLSTLDGAATVLPKTNTPPPFEVQCPLLSLAKVFGTNLQNIPRQPYLPADPALATPWAAELKDEKRLKAGITWAGSAKFRSRAKSIPIEFLSPLGRVEDVCYVSLQQDQPGVVPPGMQTRDWCSELGDLAETAALIANLDVVVSIDTAAAHLAGAVGKKVYLLLAHSADWRWLRDRRDSPWYPSMRIFRQQRPGDWNTVIAEVAEALKSEPRI